VVDYPAVTSPAQANFKDGQSGSFTVSTAGSPVSTLSIVGALPPGLGVTTGPNGTAMISGIPAKTDSGPYPVLVEATNGVGPGADQLLTVYAGPVGSVRPSLSGGGSYTFHAGKNGSYKLAASGSPSPTISLVGALPPGLTSTVSGHKLGIAGRALAGGAGTYALTVTASNAAGTTSKSIFVTVAAAPTITSANQVTFTGATADQFPISATGGFPGSTTLSITGALPPGVTFVDDGGGVGMLSGAPTTARQKTYALVIAAGNGAGTTHQAFRLTVVP